MKLSKVGKSQFGGSSNQMGLPLLTTILSCVYFCVYPFRGHNAKQVAVWEIRGISSAPPPVYTIRSSSWSRRR